MPKEEELSALIKRIEKVLYAEFGPGPGVAGHKLAQIVKDNPDVDFNLPYFTVGDDKLTLLCLIYERQTQCAAYVIPQLKRQLDKDQDPITIYTAPTQNGKSPLLVLLERKYRRGPYPFGVLRELVDLLLKNNIAFTENEKQAIRALNDEYGNNNKTISSVLDKMLGNESSSPHKRTRYNANAETPPLEATPSATPSPPPINPEQKKELVNLIEECNKEYSEFLGPRETEKRAKLYQAVEAYLTENPGATELRNLFADFKTTMRGKLIPNTYQPPSPRTTAASAMLNMKRDPQHALVEKYKEELQEQIQAWQKIDRNIRRILESARTFNLQKGPIMRAILNPALRLDAWRHYPVTPKKKPSPT